MLQAESTKVMMEQDMERTKNKRQGVLDSFYKTPLHSNTPMSQYLQKEAESMLQVETNEAEKYISVRVSINTWLVLRGIPRKDIQISQSQSLNRFKK